MECVRVRGVREREAGERGEDEREGEGGGERSRQTPSTGLQHPSFGGRCRKAVLGVWKVPESDARSVRSRVCTEERGGDRERRTRETDGQKGAKSPTRSRVR